MLYRVEANMRSFGLLNTSSRVIYNSRHPIQFTHHVFRRSHFNSNSEALASSPRFVMITGGSKGIGLAIARAFINRGDQVHIIARNSERLSQIVQTWNEHEASSKHEFTAGDISDPKFWETLKHQVSKYPDVLINAAGISQNKILLRQSADDIEKIVQTNLTGTILACRQISAWMLQERTGRRQRGHLSVKLNSGGESSSNVSRTHCIINISSLLALQGGRGASVYAASKAGVLGLTRALASELGPAGIRVNAIVPGYVETDMTVCKIHHLYSNPFSKRTGLAMAEFAFTIISLEQAMLTQLVSAFSKSLREKILERIPLSRFGTPDEIAQAALFLADNEYANNCLINLDGGLSTVSSMLHFLSYSDTRILARHELISILQT